MKRGRPVGKTSLINLSGLAGSHNYQAYYQEKNYNDIILNLEILKELIKNFSFKENVTINNTNEAVKFLNNSLKEYLKNIIQQLIENNRRRTYSKYIPIPKQNKIIEFGINVQRDPNPLINQKKNKFFPQKNLTLMCTINTEKKLNLLNQYNALKKNKIYKNEEEYEKDEKSEFNKEDDKAAEKMDEGSNSSEYDFFQKKRKENKNKKDYKGIMNVYQSHELTTNKNFIFKNSKPSHIELRDLIYYLEENQTIPWNKNLLFDAYTEMTIKGK